MPELSFEYQRRPVTTVIAAFILLSLTVLLAVIAIQADVPEIDFGAFVLEGSAAAVAFLLLGAVFAATAVYLTYSSFWVQRGDRNVVLGPSSLSAFKTASSAHLVKVPYSQILSVQRAPVYRSWHLIVRHHEGKIHIPEAYLASWDEFLTLEEELNRRVGLNRK